MNVVYGVGDSGLIIKTTDGGATWNRLQSNTDNTLLNIKRVPNGSIYITIQRRKCVDKRRIGNDSKFGGISR